MDSPTSRISRSWITGMDISVLVPVMPEPGVELGYAITSSGFSIFIYNKY